MDDTICKLALAAFLQNIGKFAERSGMDVIQECPNTNASLYERKPFHKHAVYTAAFIEKYKDLLPPELDIGTLGQVDSFISLAAMHHKPETPLQHVITMAGRISGGMDRGEFEQYAGDPGAKDCRKTRLIPILEGVRTDEQWSEDRPESYKYRFLLRDVSPTSIFPRPAGRDESLTDTEAALEYRRLFDSFIEGLVRLNHRTRISLWFQHFDSLLMLFTSHIPEATVGKVIPDVSLYDHSRTTAAIATAAYLYHLRNDSLRENDIANDEETKFLVVTGDFYGIQNFIFSEGGSTNKAAAKLLRGRSFAVSLCSELAAHMLCEQTGLPHCSVVLNAAGKFTAILPNIDEARRGVDETEERINDWLIGSYYGEVSMGLSAVEASCSDFLSGNFEKLWERISAASEKRKYQKIDLERYGGAVADYLGRFNPNLDRKLCPFCGKRPSSADVENDPVLGDTKSACVICRDNIYLGTKLVKAKRLAVVSIDANIRGDRLREPIFGRYQVLLDMRGNPDPMADEDGLIKCWDVSRAKDGSSVRGITTKFLNGYVPIFSDADSNKDTLDRLLSGRRSARKAEELSDMATRELGQPKPFNWLAKMALTPGKEGRFFGIEALGILKADIDYLGVVFGCGMRHPSLSRLSTLSRQVNHYFAIYLPWVLESRAEFNDVYTVFAGGDDLFLIGPWNRMIEFARFLRDSFNDYVCGNDRLTISTGIFLCKPGEPVLSMAEKAEESLKLAKGNGRDSITLFGIPVKWKTFYDLESIRENMNAWISHETINNAMLYRFNELTDMAGKEKDLLLKEEVSLEELECLKWKARFKYSIARNVGKHLKGEERQETMEDVERMVQWLDRYGYAMRIPLWQILYGQR